MNPLEFFFWAQPDEEDPQAWNGQLFVPDENFTLVTCGDSLEETLVHAVDLVDIWITHCWETNRDLGNDKPWQGDYRARPSLRVQSAWMVRALRREQGLTQAEAAKLVGVSQQAYAKLEDPRRSNATMGTLDRIARAFRRPIQFVA